MRDRKEAIKAALSLTDDCEGFDVEDIIALAEYLNSGRPPKTVVTLAEHLNSEKPPEPSRLAAQEREDAIVDNERLAHENDRLRANLDAVKKQYRGALKQLESLAFAANQPTVTGTAARLRAERDRDELLAAARDALSVVEELHPDLSLDRLSAVVAKLDKG